MIRENFSGILYIHILVIFAMEPLCHGYVFFYCWIITQEQMGAWNIIIMEVNISLMEIGYHFITKVYIFFLRKGGVVVELEITLYHFAHGQWTINYNMNNEIQII